MKKHWKFALTAVALLVVTGRTTYAAADWDEDDDSAKAKPVASARNYPGSADEQDLKVQATIPASGRLPDSAAHPDKGHPVDDDGNPTDD